MVMAHRQAVKSGASIARPQFVSFANTSELLIHLSKRVIEILNARDYRNPFLNCLSPNLVGTNEEYPNHGKEQVLIDFQRMVQRYPNYRADIQNVTCCVNDDSGEATVVMTARISGYAFNTVRQAAALFTWTRDRDCWTCARWELVRRIEEFD